MSSSYKFHLPLCVVLLSLCLSATVLAASEPQSRKTVTAQITAAYENTTITEDVSWSGTVLVKGALVVAPQATLRIEPGAVIRFSATKESRQLPRLVVMGRIQAVGTSANPILFTTFSATPAKAGEWGGILLLSSEKRNQLEQCRIEGAEVGLEGRFSTFSVKSITFAASATGLVLRDSTGSVTASTVSGCETGVEAHDSELEVRDSTVSQNRHGMNLFRTSVVLSSVTVSGNNQLGLLAEECRIKMTSCEISANRVGAQIKGGEGLLFLSRFVRNNETALHLVSARLKVNRCRISDNLRNGLRLEDSRATIWGNYFSGNGNYNLINGGLETITAVQNWWGASDEISITSKLFDAAQDQRAGKVTVFPWLLEKPAALP
ncbi:MAG: right-handed parallel beta-helix repeat-containing protein [Desulfuromonadales bacterium]|nr:right-handed parallel beta-helix repeat-containing protein [Desulfuromonadales bacterium]